VRGAFRTERVASDILVARVRSRLRRTLDHPAAIDVEAREGRITLHGPILASRMDDVIAAVRSVRGVRDVDNQLELYANEDNIPHHPPGPPARSAGPLCTAPQLALGVAGAGTALAIIALRRRRRAA
jgi:hypothetical protein